MQFVFSDSYVNVNSGIYGEVWKKYGGEAVLIPESKRKNSPTASYLEINENNKNLKTKDLAKRKQDRRFV